MKSRITHFLIAMAAILVLVQATRSIEIIAQEKTAIEVMYLPSGECMRMASLGYRNLASDLLWFKAIQYYGGYMLAQNGIRLFSHLADVITDLDPNFTGAYKLSALIISEDLDNYEEGVKLLEKGVRNNPGDFWLMYELGFIHYLGGRNYSEAQRYFELAASLPGANEKAARFAADAASKGKNLEDSVALWGDLAENSENKYIRELAFRYIKDLQKRMAERKLTE